jgi:hypothetical protein
MNSNLRIPLQTTAEQHARLVALQAAFAEVCNALAPTVQQTRTWNRVALHHLSYKGLRERFPALGSQMVCNAIYSVSRASRVVFQTPGSPFHIGRLAGQPLPLMRFTANAPVYFDRHTLSIKSGTASMFTLDGRMKFQLELNAEQERAFHQRKLREIVLTRVSGGYELHFFFGEALGEPVHEVSAPPAEPTGAEKPTLSVSKMSLVPVTDDQPPVHLPDYLEVTHHA